MWGNFSSSLGRATANFRSRSSGGIGEIGWAVIACLFISRLVSGYSSQASFLLAIRVLLASFGRVFPQFFQKPQQYQPFVFRKDAGHIFHRGCVLAEAPG